ncbi:MAG: DUF5723 family protein [Bacteroidales bacterium]
MVALRKKLVGILAGLGVCVFAINAQNDVGMYFMRELPQSSFLNPAHQIPCNVFVGMPLLSSIHAGYDNSLFSYNNVIIRNPQDSLIPNFDFFLTHSRAGKIEFIRTELELSLIHFGFKIKKKYYVTFFIRDRADVGLLYPINLIRLPLAGNTPYIGTTYRMDGLRFFGNYFREWALGLSKTIDERLTVGARAQLLFGKANLHTYYNRLYLYTNPDIYQLETGSSLQINGSPLLVTIDNNNQLQNVEIPSMSVTSLLLNRKNKGLALSAGAMYQYTDDIVLEASLLDVGAIYWRYVPVRVQEKANFTYNGFRYNPVTRQFENAQQTIDSALQSYTLSAAQKNYVTALSPKLYVGGTYRLKPWLQLGILLRNELYHNRLNTSLTSTLLVNYKALSLVANWTYIHRSLLNPGIGINIQTRRLGFYAISDNVYGIFKYKSMRYSNLRFGFNLFWGCPRSSQVSETVCPAYDNLPQKRYRLKELKSK